MNMPPILVGVTGRRVRGADLPESDARFTAESVDMYYSSYATKLARLGAVPVLLPFEAAGRGVMSRLDALVLSGGQDLTAPNDENRGTGNGTGPGTENGAENGAEKSGPDMNRGPGDPDQRRDAYELALTHEAIAAGVPVLGVCRGHQLLNVALGGTLQQQVAISDVVHDDPASPEHSVGHLVQFERGTLAQRLFGDTRTVNSWHHQCIDKPGTGVRITGRSPDGVPEAIEVDDHPVLGVQWHPELTTTTDPALEWLLDAARRRSGHAEPGNVEPGNGRPRWPA